MIPALTWRMFCKSLSVTTLSLTWAFAQSAAAEEAAKFNETVLYSFCSQPYCNDGQYSTSGLIEVDGTLYGTTINGGLFGPGTVFAFNPTTGAETVVYSFCGEQNCIDGAIPHSGLTNVKGTFYGATLIGGANDSGTVFALDPITGAERVVYSFCGQQNCSDGASPDGTLIKVGGMLYGTTNEGGPGNDGTLFALDPKTGTEAVLHSFCSQQNCADGLGPEGNLIDVEGVLYGTTSGGGSNGYPGGTVFSFDPNTGSVTTLYSFCGQQNCADGSEPLAGLIVVNGIFYGTTSYGGAYEGGTVFALDPATGVETVLHSFCGESNCKDGGAPLASLTYFKGKLYGTTVGGGANCGTRNYCGTVFSLDLATNSEAVVYNFCSDRKCTDGASPEANLLEVDGTLYGTTSDGGSNCKSMRGCGTLFALKRH